MVVHDLVRAYQTIPRAPAQRAIRPGPPLAQKHSDSDDRVPGCDGAEPTETERLLAEEAERERRERRLAEQATEPAEERAAERRADKAAYLADKLREREASES